MYDVTCPACGGDMKHWNQGIYECEECGLMTDLESIDEFLN